MLFESIAPSLISAHFTLYNYAIMNAARLHQLRCNCVITGVLPIKIIILNSCNIPAYRRLFMISFFLSTSNIIRSNLSLYNKQHRDGFTVLRHLILALLKNVIFVLNLVQERNVGRIIKYLFSCNC